MTTIKDELPAAENTEIQSLQANGVVPQPTAPDRWTRRLIFFQLFQRFPDAFSRHCMNLPGDASNPSGDEPARPRRKRTLGKNVSQLLGILFLVFQGVLLGYARLQEHPNVHLSPVGGYTSYRMFVTIDGRSLDPSQISARYKIPHRGRTTLTPEGLHNIIRGYESYSGSSHEIHIRLHTRFNNNSEEVWLWPQM